jgi:hypothetical protein
MALQNSGLVKIILYNWTLTDNDDLAEKSSIPIFRNELKRVN